jgi:GT2 family glycosyltransferase
MSDAKASVIVLVWNGMGYVKPCLDSVLAQGLTDFEVIVVDNGSSDGSADFVAESYPQVRLIRNKRNLGFAAGNNIGLEAATGEVLVLLNQDTEVHEGWLEALISTFDDASIGIAGCKLLYPDGTIQHAGGVLLGPRGETGHVGRHEEDAGRFEELTDAEFVTAAALAISRAALERVGALDEGFAPAYYEDIDWCFRTRAEGFRVVYQPRAVATHYESTSTAASGFTRGVALNQGRIRLMLKHRTVDELLEEFGPAEFNWLLTVEHGDELRAARRAYLLGLLTLSQILAAKGSRAGDAEALIGLLVELDLAARAGLFSHATRTAEGEPTSSILPSHTDMQLRLQEMQTLQEQPFTSQVPVLGRLIVAFRSLWNSVAAKWHVRPLIQQQSAFNALVIAYLEELSKDVADGDWGFENMAKQIAKSEAQRQGTPPEQYS